MASEEFCPKFLFLVTKSESEVAQQIFPKRFEIFANNSGILALFSVLIVNIENY